MWEFQDFYASQILREINFGDFEAPKIAIEQLWILNFWELLTFFKKSKFKAFKIVKMAVLELLKSAQIDFT